ncbi:MAG TPA: carbamoyltransferase HypF [Gemmatimonadales bacterium]|nr:carbamoyltransferase HypF [Gemmatimonadales bacterium]
MTAVAGAPRAALDLRVTGVVQGVGFRPFVHRLAQRHGVAGWVRNASGDVRIWVEGVPAALDAFARDLEGDAPPLARIERVECSRRAARGLDQFFILESRVEAGRRQAIPPDVALCAACEAELFDPANRRYHYPFITCTDCGPRFTVIEAMPYDRSATSMAAFQQCPACLAEYETPGDRRHHSQTNSCPACGPKVWFERAGEPAVSGADAIAAAARALRSGAIVALRGLGGFHLAVAATDEPAVRRLRERKHREAKPLAVMVRTLADARALAALTDAERVILESRERPIVLVAPKRGSGLAPAVAPGLDTVGLMLAYTPLHHLLLEGVGHPLVMTSGNRSDEPIAIDNDEARHRLDGIADAFLLHDREITSRYDDSVIRVSRRHPLFLRRARGYAPLPIALPVPAPTALVAVGPHLKNTFTLAQGGEAYVSQHIGDLESLETLEHFRSTLETYRRLFHVEPAVVARDLHPGYLSSRIAAELAGAERRVIPVQHHHAHVAAVLAEWGRTTPAVGLAFDGTGYGADGKVWGAEVLVADLRRYRRAAHLRYAPLPGGDLAVRHPWRAALGYASLGGDARAFAPALATVSEREREVAERQVREHVNAPLASSLGRLFDAAAAVLGVCRSAGYEGEAGMRLESLAGRRAAAPLPFPVTETPEGWELDPVPLLVALGERAQRGADVRDLAARFHESVAAAAADVAGRVAGRANLRVVALGGGCFQNVRLLEACVTRLEARGFEVLVPRRLSPNDGAVSYGQAAVAAAILAGEG